MVWHFQLVLWATPCHCPWTWRSPAASTPSFPWLPPNSPYTLPHTVLQKQPTTMLPCGTAWVAKAPTPVPPFQPRIQCPPQPSVPSAEITINQRDCSRHRLMMRAGGSRPLVVWDVRWGVRVRSGTDLCWGQRTLDSGLSKTDSLCIGFLISCF